MADQPMEIDENQPHPQPQPQPPPPPPMQRYLTSVGLLWAEGNELVSGKLVYRNPDKSGVVYVLARYESSEVAEQIFKALKREGHPNFATAILPCFKVEGENGVFLAMRKVGTSLEEALRVSNEEFREDNRITQLYQKILEVLLIAVRHSIDTDIQCTLNLSCIYVLQKPVPYVTITHFAQRVAREYNNDFAKLATIIKEINKTTGFVEINKTTDHDREEEKSDEMKKFIFFLDNINRRLLNKIYALPLFWTPLERETFPSRLWESIKCRNLNFLLSHDYPQFEGRKWTIIVDGNDRLRALKRKLDSYKDPRMRMTERAAHSLANEPILEMREFLKFIRKCSAHFQEIKAKGQLTKMNLNNGDDVAKLFESKFKDYIMRLHLVAEKIEANFGITILPKKENLRELYRLPS